MNQKTIEHDLWRYVEQYKDVPEEQLTWQAVTSGAHAGTIYRFDALRQALPASLSFYSSHTFGTAETIELARALGQLPPHLVVYAVEGKDFALGAGLSPEVERAIREVVARVVDEVNDEICYDLYR